MSNNPKLKNTSKDSVVDEDELYTGPKFAKKDIPEDEVESFDFYQYSYKLLSKKVSFLFSSLSGLQDKTIKSGFGV